MSRSAWMMLMAAAVALSGCAKDGMRQSNPATAGHTQFETSEDPPLTAQTYFAAGQLSEVQGRYDNAIKQYEQALKLDRHNLPARFRLAVIHTQLKQYPQAVAQWRQYIEETKDPAGGYANLGYTQELAGQIADAEASFKKGISLDPQSQPCHVNYGLLLARQGRADQAMTQFSAVLPPAQGHYNLGSVYEQQHKFAQARAEYEAALKLNPSFTDARKRLEMLPVAEKESQDHR